MAEKQISEACFRNAQIKRLYRSKTNRVIAGILGGVGEYLNIDPVLVRLTFVALTVFTGFIPGIIFYIVALFIVPERLTKSS